MPWSEGKMGKFLEDLGLEIHRFQGFSGVFGKIIGFPRVFWIQINNRFDVCINMLGLPDKTYLFGLVFDL